MGIQSVLGRDITSAPVMSWSVHLGADPKNSSCEPCIQLSEVPMGYYKTQYNSTCNKAELILGFQNSLAICQHISATRKQDVKNPKEVFLFPEFTVSWCGYCQAIWLLVYNQYL